MERVEVDIMGPLPVTNKGNKYILSSMIVSPSGQEAETIVTVFVNNSSVDSELPPDYSAEQSNGNIKRFNRTLTAMLMLMYCEKGWISFPGFDSIPFLKAKLYTFSPNMMVLEKHHHDVADYISNLQTADHGGSQDPYSGVLKKGPAPQVGSSPPRISIRRRMKSGLTSTPRTTCDRCDLILGGVGQQ